MKSYKDLEVLNFIKDIHGLDDIIQSLNDSYNNLGRKMNRFIQYVENEWK